MARALVLVPLLGLTFACVGVRSGFGIGDEDNGTTKNVKVGSELRLVLPPTSIGSSNRRTRPRLRPGAVRWETWMVLQRGYGCSM